jgi:hypothetical protein
MTFRRVAQRLAQRAAGFDLREPRPRIDRDDTMHILHILRALDHDCDVHALSALRGARSARGERRGVLAANRATVGSISSTERGST